MLCSLSSKWYVCNTESLNIVFKYVLLKIFLKTTQDRKERSYPQECLTDRANSAVSVLRLLHPKTTLRRYRLTAMPCRTHRHAQPAPGGAVPRRSRTGPREEPGRLRRAAATGRWRGPGGRAVRASPSATLSAPGKARSYS